MEKEQALKRLTSLEKEAKELRKIIESSEKSNYERAKEWLLDYISKPFEVKLTKGYITYYRGNQWVIQQDFKNRIIWCYYYQLWEVFETDFNMDNEEIKALHKDVLGEALNCKDFTPLG